ncbi:hypothetical protein ISS86_00275 [Candidatus Microgenomates bacterium]|nr:hypothetical protein [Candidatus Microgenomates bacterium]
MAQAERQMTPDQLRALQAQQQEQAESGLKKFLDIGGRIATGLGELVQPSTWYTRGDIEAHPTTDGLLGTVNELCSGPTWFNREAVRERQIGKESLPGTVLGDTLAIFDPRQYRSVPGKAPDAVVQSVKYQGGTEDDANDAWASMSKIDKVNAMDQIYPSEPQAPRRAPGAFIKLAQDQAKETAGHQLGRRERGQVRKHAKEAWRSLELEQQLGFMQQLAGS